MAESNTTKSNGEGTTRTPRASDGRESSDRQTEKREMSFDSNMHSEMLPVPDPRDGIDFRYVRVTTRGQTDGRNFTNAQRAGWEPVSKKDMPELEYVLSDMNHPLEGRTSDAIVIGGLVLCQRASEIGKRLQAMADDEARKQVASVDQDYLKDQDSRMRKFSEGGSKVQFGN